MDRRDLLRALRFPERLDWRAHGIGFIKAYVDEAKTLRLNVYNSMFITPGVTLHHDHPWALDSTILVGELTNERYKRVPRGAKDSVVYNEGVINCANFDFTVKDVREQALRRTMLEVFSPGHFYYQDADEVHATRAIDGTVTLMGRSNFRPDGTARVYWPVGEDWIDATHELKPEEVRIACDVALLRMENK